VFEIGEDGFPSIIPQRVGERDAGVSQERVMHSTVGSYSGIRTVEHENHDKSITSLRTRSGWPVFETEGETSAYTPPVYCFQGFPASQHVVYGVKVSGVNYVAADPGDPELWHFGGKNVLPFSALQTTLIDANADWYDTTGVVEGVVTWRAMKSLARNGGSSFIKDNTSLIREAPYYRSVGYNPPFIYDFPGTSGNVIDIVPCDSFLRKSSLGGTARLEIYLDGNRFEINTPSGTYTVVCAANHSSGKVRAIIGRFIGNPLDTNNVSGGSSDPEYTPESPRCYPEKRYYLCDTLYLIEQGSAQPIFSDGWSLIDTISLSPTLEGTFPYLYPARDVNGLPIEGNGYVSFLQNPLFNSSATKAVGIMTECYPKYTASVQYTGIGNNTPDRAAARDWVFEIDFSAGTLTKLEVATYFESSGYVNGDDYGGTENRYRVLAVDYVGDAIKYLRFSRSYYLENVGDTTTYRLVHSYYTDSVKQSWGEGQTWTEADTFDPIPFGTPITLYSYNLRNDFACYSTNPASIVAPISGGFNVLINSPLPDNQHIGTVTTEKRHRYMNAGGAFAEGNYQYFGEFVRYVTCYPGEQIAVYSYAMIGQNPPGRSNLVVGNVVTDLLPLIAKAPYLGVPDGLPSLFCPLFYRKE